MTSRNKSRRWVQVLAASLLLTAATQLMAAPKVSVEPDRKTALYEMGESASFTIKVTDDGKPVLAGSLSYLVDNFLDKQ